jgi:nitronate monooxygenase
MAAPMFIASSPELVVAQCNAGIIGSTAAHNARSTAEFDENLANIREQVQDKPFGVNLIAHSSNLRLDADLAMILRHRVPIVVLALAADANLIRELQANGVIVLQDIISTRHARKSAEMGVDGLIAVSAGAGGHTGQLSPFALVQEIREWWDGLLILAGCIANGRTLLAAEILGADLGYIGSPFLACTEANTSFEFKQMVADSQAADIVTTDCFTGVKANFLKRSLRAYGYDPDRLVRPQDARIDVSRDMVQDEIAGKPWRDIWSAGQGINAVKKVGSVAQYIDDLAYDYVQAKVGFGIAG